MEVGLFRLLVLGGLGFFMDQPAPGPAPAALGIEEFLTLGVGRANLAAEPTEQPSTPLPDTLERSQESRRPLRYLDDYHIGHVNLSPQKSCAPSTGENSEPRMQSTPGSVKLLQRQRPPD